MTLYAHATPRSSIMEFAMKLATLGFVALTEATVPYAESAVIFKQVVLNNSMMEIVTQSAMTLFATMTAETATSPQLSCTFPPLEKALI